MAIDEQTGPSESSKATTTQPTTADTANPQQAAQPKHASPAPNNDPPSTMSNGASAPASVPAVASAPSQATAPAAGEAQTISRDEVALYDRQIRLWGMQAQQQIRSAKILLVTVKGLGNEIAKNLVLAGIESLTISDKQPLTEEDLGSQFFIDEQDVREGKTREEAALPRIQKLNQRVKVSKLEDNPFAATDASFLAPFTIVIGTDLPVLFLNQLSAACRFAHKPFYAGGSHGFYGYIFADLIQHSFSITRDAPNVPTTVGKMETPTREIIGSHVTTANGKRTEQITKKETYQPFILINSAPLPQDIVSKPRALRRVPVLLPFLRALWTFEQANNGLPPNVGDRTQLAYFTQQATEKSRELQLPMDHVKADALRSFLQNVYLELAPTAAFLGAALAQDVINVLSNREQPIQNLMLFDGEEGTSEIIPLHPLVTTQDINIS